MNTHIKNNAHTFTWDPHSCYGVHALLQKSPPGKSALLVLPWEKRLEMFANLSYDGEPVAKGLPTSWDHIFVCLLHYIQLFVEEGLGQNVNVYLCFFAFHRAPL